MYFLSVSCSGVLWGYQYPIPSSASNSKFSVWMVFENSCFPLLLQSMQFQLHKFHSVTALHQSSTHRGFQPFLCTPVPSGLTLLVLDLLGGGKSMDNMHDEVDTGQLLLTLTLSIHSCIHNSNQPGKLGIWNYSWWQSWCTAWYPIPSLQWWPATNGEYWSCITSMWLMMAQVNNFFLPTRSKRYLWSVTPDQGSPEHQLC